jgi:hypothetical protein
MTITTMVRRFIAIFIFIFAGRTIIAGTLMQRQVLVFSMD